MAVPDSEDLALELTSPSHGADVFAAVKAFDDRAQPRCIRARRMSHFSMTVWHSSGLKHRILRALFQCTLGIMRRARRCESPYWELLRPLALSPP